MTNDMDGDVFETQLIKNAVAPFNDFFLSLFQMLRTGLCAHLSWRI